MSFAWDLPDGPLQRALAPVIGVRRLLAQADAEEYGSLLEILDDRDKTVARLRIESGRARLPMSAQCLATAAHHGHADGPARLRGRVRAARAGDREPPWHRVLSRGSPRRDAPPGRRTGARRRFVAPRGPRADGPRGRRGPADSSGAARHPRGQRAAVSAPISTRSSSTTSAWPSGARARCSARSGTCSRPTPSSTSRPSSRGSVVSPARRATWTCSSSRFREHRGDVPAGDMEALTAFLGQAQQQEHQRLVEALDSDRYRRLLSEWEAFLKRPAPPRAGGPQRRTPPRGSGFAACLAPEPANRRQR